MSHDVWGATPEGRFAPGYDVPETGAAPTVTNMSLDTGENARASFDGKHMTDAVNQGGYVHAMSGAIRISLTYR